MSDHSTCCENALLVQRVAQHLLVGLPNRLALTLQSRTRHLGARLAVVRAHALHIELTLGIGTRQPHAGKQMVQNPVVENHHARAIV